MLRSLATQRKPLTIYVDITEGNKGMIKRMLKPIVFVGVVIAAAIAMTIYVTAQSAGQLLVNEVEFDPPSTVSDGCQYVEIRGVTPGGMVPANTWFITLDNSNANPGNIAFAVNLGGQVVGANGTITIVNSSAGFCTNRVIPSETTVVTVAQPLGLGFFSSRAFLLVNSATAFLGGQNIDMNQDGQFDFAVTVIDGFAFNINQEEEFNYGGSPKIFAPTDGSIDVPDAVTRFPNNTTPLTGSAFYYGELASSPDETTQYAAPLSANFPVGGMLTPGAQNAPGGAPTPTPTPTPTATPTPTPTPGPNTIQFNSNAFSEGEGNLQILTTVTRIGNTAGAATVEYATSDLSAGAECDVDTGAASPRCDYIQTVGTLSFAAGETSKDLPVLIIDDAYSEGNETLTITLSNPNGATLGSQSTATLTITDNDLADGPNNPIDDAGFFVRQHYLDVLNRQPDAPGLAFWTDQITSCGNNASCIEVKRINVSASFFLSIEFQGTGFLVYRLHKSAFGNLPGAPVPIVLSDFLRDTQSISRGIIVGSPGWEQALANNQQAFTLAFVQTQKFLAAFPTTMTADEFVTKLDTNAGGVLSPAEKANLIAVLGATPADTSKRAEVLRGVADDPDLRSREVNKAFVLTEYFTYLRRNADGPPDNNFSGFDFWLDKLNKFNGNAIDAEMVKAFITSIEYRKRFAA